MDIEDLGRLVKSEVVSASRRTDIPAFYMDVVVEAMKKGFIMSKTRYGQINRISLDPKDVKCISWWSKDYKNWLVAYNNNPELFGRYKHMFNMTLTGGDELETGVMSSLGDRLEQMKTLAEMFTPQAVKYRFDPIVVYTDLGTSERLNNLKYFRKITKFASKCGIDEVIIAFCLPYKQVVARMRRRGKLLIDLSQEGKERILDDLIKIADRYGVKISACSSEKIVGYRNKIFPSKCIDGNEIEELLGHKLTKNIKDKGQREECNCVISKDIGSYTMVCYHNCDYCYANPNENK